MGWAGRLLGIESPIASAAWGTSAHAITHKSGQRGRVTVPVVVVVVIGVGGVGVGTDRGFGREKSGARNGS
jgi:hypothetical protein